MSTKFVDASEFFSYIISMSPEQCRAARGWLTWSQQELADRARVSVSTVRDFEAGRRQPIPNNLFAMQQAIETAGIRLIDENRNAVGIRIDSDANTSSSGSEGGASEPERTPSDQTEADGKR